ncbi:MAG TPA: hypothetical protein VGL99_29110 [Chloroflexota bacterium]
MDLGALTEYARDIAPHVDRLATAVHRHAGPDGRAVIQSYGLPNAGVLIDVRALLLGGPISFDDLATIDATRRATRCRRRSTSTCARLCSTAPNTTSP